MTSAGEQSLMQSTVAMYTHLWLHNTQTAQKTRPTRTQTVFLFSQLFLKIYFLYLFLSILSYSSIAVQVPKHPMYSMLNVAVYVLVEYTVLLLWPHLQNRPTVKNNQRQKHEEEVCHI